MLSDHLASLKALVDEAEDLRSRVKSLESRERLYATWLQYCIQRYGTSGKITRTKEGIEALVSNDHKLLVFGALEVSLEDNLTTTYQNVEQSVNS